MGACSSKSNNKGRLRSNSNSNSNGNGNYAWEKDPRVFMQNMKLLQQEINTVVERREEECEAYERELMVFALKETEWKKERKRLRDVAKAVRKKLVEREEKIRVMEIEVDQLIINNNNINNINNINNNNGRIIENYEGRIEVNCNGSSCVGSSSNSKNSKNSSSKNSKSVEVGKYGNGMSLIEQMKEERVRRDETVEKWKMLYLSIKCELDELILKTTHQGTLNWRAKEEEEKLSEEMQKELKAKDEIIQSLKAKIVMMEKEEYKRKREVDILRQSLKIMSNKNGVNSLKSRSKQPSSIIRIKKNKSFSKFGVFVK